MTSFNNNTEMLKNDLSSLNYMNLNLFSELKGNDNYVDFSGFTKEKVIKALFNSTQHMGLGRLHNDQKELTQEDILNELNTYIDQGKLIQSIDYLKGKPLKINLTKFPFINSGGYNRDSPVKMKDVLKKMGMDGKIDFVEEKIIPKAIIIKEAKGQLQVTTGDEAMEVIYQAPKGSLKWFEEVNGKQIKRWTKVYLTNNMQKIAKEMGISYETQYFIISHIETDGNNKKTYNLMGSMGGGLGGLKWDKGDIIDRIE